MAEPTTYNRQVTKAYVDTEVNLNGLSWFTGEFAWSSDTKKLFAGDAGSKICIYDNASAPWVPQTANTILAGPSSGSPAVPTFRALVDADVPDSLTLSKILNLTSNGFVKTSGGDGTLSVDTTSYQPLDATLTSLAGLSAVQGDIIYGSGADAYALLNKSTSTSYYLKNSGTNNNPAWAAINQSDVGGLTTSSSPEFVTVKLSGLTDGYVPYHVSDASGLANSNIYTDGTYVGIGTTTLGSTRLRLKSVGVSGSDFVIVQSTSSTNIVELGQDGSGNPSFHLKYSDGSAQTSLRGGGDSFLNAVAGGVAIGANTVTSGYMLDVIGKIRTTGQFTSTLATGTAPLAVASTTVVSNLNADLLDGQHGSYYQPLLTNPVTGTGTSGKIAKFTGTSTIGDASNTDAEVSSTVSLKHTQNTDTGTTSQTFQLYSGSSGAKLIASGGGGGVSIRNSGDTAYESLSALSLSSYNSVGGYSSLQRSDANLTARIVTIPDAAGYLQIGSLTAGYLPYSSASGVLSNSPLYTDGTNVAISDTNPPNKFYIKLPDSGYPTDPTHIADSAIHIYNSTHVGSLSSISFGYRVPTTVVHTTAYIGYVSTDVNAAGKGSLVFGTRDSTSDVGASERMRITCDARLGFLTTTPGAAFHVGSTDAFVEMFIGNAVADAGHVLAMGWYNTHYGFLRMHSWDNKGIYLNSTGVGIGTTAGYLFEVNGSIASEYISRFYNTSSTGYGLYIRGGGASSSYGCLLVENYAGTCVLYARGDGYVGLNTTTPQGYLDIRSPTNPEYGWYFGGTNELNYGYGVNADYAWWVNYRGYASGSSQFRDFIVGNGKYSVVLYVDGSTSRIGIRDSEPLGSLGFGYSTASIFWRNSALAQPDSRAWEIVGEQGAYGILQIRSSDANDNTIDRTVVTFDKDGNTGFGTPTPAAKVHVVPPANTEAIRADGYSLTGSDTHHLLYMAGTWNTSGVVQAIELNITNVSSDAASNLLNLKLDSVSKFVVRKDGKVGINQPTPTALLELLNADANNVPALFIDHNETGVYPALKIDSEADDNAVQVAGKYCLSLTQDISSGRCLYAIRNLNEAGVAPLASFVDEHSSCTQDTVYIRQDGSGLALNVVGNAYFSANVSALSFTDRTPMFVGDALSLINKIKALPTGELDHSTLPAFALVKKMMRVEKAVAVNGKHLTYHDIEEIPFRNIGNMLSLHTVAIQQLSAMFDPRDRRIAELESEVTNLKSRVQELEYAN